MTEAAAWVIRQDPKLLGIPSVRTTLIEMAVKIAKGAARAPSPSEVTFTHADNVPAVLDALRRAVEAARRVSAPAI
jgi:hypothetical protein